MSMSGIALWAASACLALAEPGPELSAPSPEQIQQAVRDLGDDNFAVRERASRFLWQAGRAAESALHEAVGSDDAEVAARARRILTQFKFGIYPDTPPEQAALISRFRLGDLGGKQVVLRQLAAQGDAALMLTLLRSEENDPLRQQLTQSLLGELDKIVPGLLVAGEKERAEQFLELGAAGADGMRNYAAYLLLSGRIDARIEEVRARAQAKADAADGRLLAYLLRAKGDLAGARAAAEKANHEELILGLLSESGDWAALAAHQKAEADKRSVQLSKPVESLGYLAAYQRLAGNREEFGETVERLKKLAAERPETRWHAAEALLINGRIDEAIGLLREEHRPTAFDVLAAQLRFREALALEGVHEVQSLPRPWMAASPSPQPKSDAERRKAVLERFHAGVRVAGLLARLGEEETAGDLFAELVQAAEEDRALPVQAVLEAEYGAGLRAPAIHHAAAAIERLSPRPVLGALYPKQSDAAEVWYEFFRAAQAGAPAIEALAKVDELLGPPQRGAAGAGPSDALLRQAEDHAKTLAPPARVRWLGALGETCELHGRAKESRRYFEEADAASPSPASRIRVGDLLAADGQWKLAADCYRQAWERDKRQSLALFLQGWALERAGEVQEAAKWKDLALLAPLAGPGARYQLAKGLDERGLDEEAARQWEVVLRTGPFDDWAVNEAARQLGNRLSGADNLRAAMLWERLLLSCLKTSTAASQVEGYLRLGHLVHKARGRGLLSAGRKAEALEHFEAARQALPGEGKLAEDVVPELEAAGLRAEADALFEKVYQANVQAAADFPKAAVYHNNAAWVAARCGRRLDEALRHATRANELAPGHAGYLDTLAEVHFRLGDRQEAVRLAKRCLELAPEDPHFRKQLERFEKGE